MDSSYILSATEAVSVSCSRLIVPQFCYEESIDFWTIMTCLLPVANEYGLLNSLHVTWLCRVLWPTEGNTIVRTTKMYFSFREHAKFLRNFHANIFFSPRGNISTGNQMLQINSNWTVPYLQNLPSIYWTLTWCHY